jgi:hypothetical protein
VQGKEFIYLLRLEALDRKDVSPHLSPGSLFIDLECSSHKDSDEYVFSQNIAIRKWTTLGFSIRASLICVVCRSEKTAQQVSGLAPK